MHPNIIDFESFYASQLNVAEVLPDNIKEKYTLTACLSMTDDKCIYIITESITGKQYILKKVSKKHLNQSEMERDILLSLDHPSIPKIHKWFDDGEYTYMIKDYFEGITLDALVVGSSPLPEVQVIDLGVKICDLLIYLHHGKPPIIHRDIKPQNIILCPNGLIGLIDFDTSRRFDLESRHDTVYMGTLQTAAPEQFGYRQTDQKTDIYSLGIILIYLCTGSYDRAGVLNMPSRLRKVAQKCTEFSPDDRYVTVDQVKFDLLHKNSADARKSKITLFAAFSFIVLAVFLLFIILQFYFPHFLKIDIDPESTPAPTHNVIADTSSGSILNPTLAPTPAPTPVAITFQSPRIEQAVREEVGKTNGEPLTKTDLSQVFHLYIIGDLPTAIAYGDIRHDYTSRQISLADKQIFRGTIDTLADLEMLPSLNDLTLVYQQITDLSGVENLHLSKLNIAYNNVTDLTPIKDMTTLSWLSVICNPIEDISCLENLTKLGYLQLCGTSVTDLTPLSDMQSLTVLDLYGMENMDLTPLSALEKLTIIQKVN